MYSPSLCGLFAFYSLIYDVCTVSLKTLLFKILFTSFHNCLYSLSHLSQAYAHHVSFKDLFHLNLSYFIYVILYRQEVLKRLSLLKSLSCGITSVYVVLSAYSPQFNMVEVHSLPLQARHIVPVPSMQPFYAEPLNSL